MLTTLRSTKPDSCQDCECFAPNVRAAPWRSGMCYAFNVLVDGMMAACCTRAASTDLEFEPIRKRAYSDWWTQNYKEKYGVKTQKRNVMHDLQDNLPLV